MSGVSQVDRLYDESVTIIAALGSDQPSLVAAASDIFRKALVLAAASYFEHRLSTCVMEFVVERAHGSTLVVSLVKNKAVSRQYHAWFNWDDTNANQFFALFGPEFKQRMIDRVRASEDLRESIRAFLEIGSERNKLVHQDFASFAMNKTLEEVYSRYRQALLFVDGLAGFFREHEQAD